MFQIITADMAIIKQVSRTPENNDRKILIITIPVMRLITIGAIPSSVVFKFSDIC